jgi:hypothetical protein
MNAEISDGHPPDNTVPPWLLPCVCQSPRCHYDARLKPDILCIRGIPYKHEPPHQPSPNVIIQYFEFTYCNDRFSSDKVASKQTKYDSLLNNIRAKGMNVAPIIIITAGARATTHISSITSLHDTFKIPIPTITHTLKNINIIAIYHAMSILLYKRRIKNHQPLPDPEYSFLFIHHICISSMQNTHLSQHPYYPSQHSHTHYNPLPHSHSFKYTHPLY